MEQRRPRRRAANAGGASAGARSNRPKRERQHHWRTGRRNGTRPARPPPGAGMWGTAAAARSGGTMIMGRCQQMGRIRRADGNTAPTCAARVRMSAVSGRCNGRSARRPAARRRGGRRNRSEPLVCDSGNAQTTLRSRPCQIRTEGQSGKTSADSIIPVFMCVTDRLSLPRFVPESVTHWPIKPSSLIADFSNWYSH